MSARFYTTIEKPNAECTELRLASNLVTGALEAIKGTDVILYFSSGEPEHWVFQGLSCSFGEHQNMIESYIFVR